MTTDDRTQGRKEETIEKDTLAERIEAQRKEIAKAMSIVEACRMGGDSMLAPMHGDDEDDDPDFEGALAAAWDLLNHVCAALEVIGREREGQ